MSLSRSVSFLAVIFAIFAIGTALCALACDSEPAPVSDPAAVVLSGNQEDLDHLTVALLREAQQIRTEWLADTRDFPRNLVVRVEDADRVTQLGVDQVGDYFLCLLQVRDGKTTLGILDELGLHDTSPCDGRDNCDVCNSLTFPVDGETREALIQYWTALSAADQTIPDSGDAQP